MRSESSDRLIRTRAYQILGSLSLLVVSLKTFGNIRRLDEFNSSGFIAALAVLRGSQAPG